MACINSNLMEKMLKYINKDIREKIISLRTTERHEILKLRKTKYFIISYL